ncbi:MAG: hypothetical protein EPN91_03495 [Salinibacterium sp.]|nr:MAG: hypothetical protein EPN91_03495 [Salinibacterium sp.]
MDFLLEVPHDFFTARWHELRTDLVRFTGDRALVLFAHAISDANNNLVCAALFRRELLEHGEDPDRPQDDEALQVLIDWGRLIATDPGGISPEFYTALATRYNQQIRVPLLEFAGQVIAANVFTAVAQVPLDESLYPYRKPGDERTR